MTNIRTESQFLSKYEAKKAALLSAYDLLKKSPEFFTFDPHIGVAQLSDREDALIQQRFFVAVAGQIKSGKSTLINALVFQDEILPADDTVMTAKNTRITYGEEPSFSATMYSADEWKEVRDHYRKSVDDFRGFNAEVVNAASLGVEENDLIGKTVTVKGLKSLRDYIAPTSKGGRFSPFVKFVEISFPSPILRHVVFVDTPGINDPLKHREDVTKNWIRAAGAVIYVSYAGKFLDREDIRFVADYLSHIPGKKKVIAINKIDTVDGGASAISHFVDDMVAKSSNELVKRAISPDVARVYTSGLIALYRAMDRSGRLSDEQRDEFEFHKKRFDGVDGFEALMKVTEDRLMDGTGQALLDDHTFYIKDLLEKAQTFSDLTEVSLNDAIAQFQLRKDEAASKKRSIGSDRKKISTKFDEFESLCDDMIAHADNIVDRVTARERDLFVSRVVAQANVVKNWESAVIRAVDEMMKIDLLINSMRSEIEQELSQRGSEFGEMISDIGILIGNEFGRRMPKMYLPRFDIKKLDDPERMSSQIQNVVNDNTWFWQRMFDTDAAFDRVRAQVSGRALAVFNNTFDHFRDVCHQFVEAKFKASIAGVESSVVEYFDELDATLESIEAGGESASTMLEGLQRRREDNAAYKTLVISLRTEILARL